MAVHGCRMRYTKEELKAPEFVLPPIDFAPNAVKNGSFRWSLGPWVKNEEREFVLSCTQCPKTYHSHWPIGNAILMENHYSKHQSALDQSTQTRVQSTSVNHGVPRGQMIFSPNLVRSAGTGPVTLSQLMVPANTGITNRWETFDINVYRSLLLPWFMVSNIPLSTVSSVHFINLVSYMYGFMPEASREDLRSDLTTMYRRDLYSVKSRIAAVKGRLSVTINLSHEVEKYVVVAISLHYISDRFTHEHITIGCDVIRKRSFGDDTLYKSVRECFEEHDLKNRIMSITINRSQSTKTLVTDLQEGTDYAKKFQEMCLQEPGVKREHGKDEPRSPTGFDGIVGVPCLEYVFEHAVKSFLRSLSFVGDIPNGVEEAMKRIAKSRPELGRFDYTFGCIPHTIRDVIEGLRYEDVIYTNFVELMEKREADATKNRPTDFPQKDKKSDWPSTLTMLEEFLEYREEFDEISRRGSLLSKEKQRLMNHDCPNFTEGDWNYIISIRDILVFFKKLAVNVKAAARDSVSRIAPCVYQTCSAIEEKSRGFEEPNPYIALALRYAQNMLLSHFPVRSENIDKMKPLYIATVLDPRCKLDAFRHAGFPDSIIDKIQQCFYEESAKYKKALEEALAGKKQKLHGEASSGLQRWLIQSSDVEEEVKLYLSEGQHDSHSKIADYYKNGKKSILYQMARDYLAIQARATPVEQFDDVASDWISREKKGVMPEEIKMAALLKSHGIFGDLPPDDWSETDGEETREIPDVEELRGDRPDNSIVLES